MHYLAKIVNWILDLFLAAGKTPETAPSRRDELD
jgi:hypothetical protein